MKQMQLSINGIVVNNLIKRENGRELNDRTYDEILHPLTV